MNLLDGSELGRETILNHAIPAQPTRKRSASGGVRVSNSRDSMIKFLVDGQGSWLNGRRQDQRSDKRYRFHDEIITVSLDLLDPHPLQPRRSVSKQDVSGLNHSIFYHGFNDPISITPQPNNPGRYYIIDGIRRCASARTLGWKDIKCHLSTATQDHEILGLMLAIDVQREGFNDIERGYAFRNYRDIFCLTPARFAEFMKISKSIVVKCERCVKNLSEKIVKQYLSSDGERLSIKHLLVLGKLHDIKFTVNDDEGEEPRWNLEQERLYHLALKEKWKLPQLRQEVNLLLDHQDLRGQESTLEVETSEFCFKVKAKRFHGTTPEEVQVMAAYAVEKMFAWRGITLEECWHWYSRMAEMAERKFREDRRLNLAKP